MAEYRISNKDIDILSQTQANDYWRSLKEASIINNIISALGIYDDKIGSTCATHF